MRYKLMMLLCLLLLVGCSTGRQAVVEGTHEKRDSVERVRIKVDTLLEKDSVMVSVETRHDTVYRTEYRERVRWKVRHEIDTLIVVRTDSLTKPIVVEKDTRASVRTRWSASTVMRIANGVLLSALLYVVWRWRRGLWK